ncbi:MAG: hypothetical protein R6W99_05595 [Clostridia bacterium]
MVRIFYFFFIVLLSSCTTDIPVFDIHFVLLTNRAEGLEKADKDLFENEIAILNQYFVTEGRKEIVRFKYRSGHFYDEIKNSSCRFIKEVADAETYYDHKRLKQLYNECNDRKVKAPHAINIYIYDSYSPTDGFADKTSRGYNNSGRPFLMLDWERIGHKIQSPEEHEMGHAFGLRHICVKDASRDSHTNIMASSANCEGSGGLRDIGFTDKQVAVILRHARNIIKTQEEQ